MRSLRNMRMAKGIILNLRPNSKNANKNLSDTSLHKMVVLIRARKLVIQMIKKSKINMTNLR
jgi:hypothetical protein